MATTQIGITDLLGAQLQVMSGGKVSTVDTSSLQGKFVCLYFSAHWCPPCKAFTPVLRKFYQTQVAAGKPIEIVFVSSDNSKSEFDDYWGNNMPWLAIPFEKRNLAQGLSRRFQILGIPSLVILDPSGRVVNKNARSALSSDLEGKNFPWPGQEDSAMGGSLMPWVVLIVLAFFYWLFVGRG